MGYTNSTKSIALTVLNQNGEDAFVMGIKVEVAEPFNSNKYDISPWQHTSCTHNKHEKDKK